MNSAILWEQKHLQFQLSFVVSFFTGYKPDSNCWGGATRHTQTTIYFQSSYKTPDTSQDEEKCKDSLYKHGNLQERKLEARQKSKGEGGNTLFWFSAQRFLSFFPRWMCCCCLHRDLGSSSVLCLNHWFLTKKFQEKDLQSGELVAAGEQVFLILNSPLGKQRGFVHKCLTSLVIKKDKW